MFLGALVSQGAMTDANASQPSTTKRVHHPKGPKTANGWWPCRPIPIEACPIMWEGEGQRGSLHREHERHLDVAAGGDGEVGGGEGCV